MATHKLIQTHTVGSGGSSGVSFTSIPSTYTDLKLVCSIRDNAGSLYSNDVKVTFNSDTNTTHYLQRNLYGSTVNTGASSNSNTNLGCFATFGAAGTSASSATFGNTEMYILNYAGSTQKSVYVDATQATADTSAGHFSVALVGGVWNQTSAITQIDVTTYNGNNMAQYSTVSLYGIKNS